MVASEMAAGHAVVSNIQQVPLLSFFTGAGFLDLGFMKNGFPIVWTNEINEFFAEGFRCGMSSLTGKSDARISCLRSIVDVGPHEILRNAFPDSPRPSIFGVIGGPPCPDFSIAGKNRGGRGENGVLTKVFFDRIRDVNPTFFVVENVPGLLRTAKHREFLYEQIRTMIPRYAVDVKILNALDFGAPQDRNRVFIVGFDARWLKSKKGIEPGSAQGWFTWPHDPRYSNAKTRYAWPKTDPFGSRPEKPVGIPDELMVGPTICTPDIEKLPNQSEGFRPKSARFHTIPEGDVSRKSFKRLHRWRFSPAVAYGNNEVHLHPTEPRRLTVREALRLQTVPDRYVLPERMSLSDKFKMVGNGVPVTLASAVAGSIASFIEEGLR